MATVTCGGDRVFRRKMVVIMPQSTTRVEPYRLPMLAFDGAGGDGFDELALEDEEHDDEGGEDDG